MIVLKIIGVIFAILALLLVLLWILRLKLVISYLGSGKPTFKVRFLGIDFGGKKKKKKKSKIAEKLKKKFGLDILENFDATSILEGTFGEKAEQIVGLVMLFATQIKWLYKKLRIDKLYAFITCGGDAADAAIDYGLVCAAVYPMVGYLSANMNLKNGAEDVNIACDFDGKTDFEFELIISVSTIHIFIAVIKALTELAEIAEKAEVINNER